MPVYTYRREDGSTFDIQQKFSDDALTTCPTTGQPVVRIIQNPGIIFKGSGFYVTDNKNGNGNGRGNGHKPESNGASDNGSAKSETKAESAAETKSEKKAEKVAE
jgi:putative FmdB family regulatory protein